VHKSLIVSLHLVAGDQGGGGGENMMSFNNGPVYMRWMYPSVKGTRTNVLGIKCSRHSHCQKKFPLLEVIEFGDSYEVPKEGAATGTASDGKNGRTVAVTTEDMQKRRNDVKTFGGNEATRKTKKNLLKQQYGNFKTEGKETLEQTFNRLQAIVSQLEFIDMEIEQDDLNQKLLTSLAPEWLMHTIILEEDWEEDLHTRAPRSQEKERRDNYRQGSKVEEQAPKALMAIDGVGWDWSYMANEEENHTLVADEEAPTEFALMAKSGTDNKVFDHSLCFKACKKNTDSLNNQIIKLSKNLGDTKNMLYHYKLGLSQVEARLVEFKNQEIKFCKKIRGLEFSVECKANIIENLTNELETLKKEKKGLDSKLTGLLEFADDTITDYTRPSSSVENSPTVAKIDKKEIVRKPTIKYTKLYRKTSKRCDNGGEFRNKEMNDFCSRKGIKREFSNARTPQQNGVAERRNMTLIEAARTMLVDAKLSVTIWAEAVNTACYVQNRVLVNKSQNKTPYELLIGRTPAIGLLKPFGYHVMILNTLDNLGKFEAKGDEGYFIGYKGSCRSRCEKDMSSLRYIALPNWFHEAHLESSTSNAQDNCNADAPESSGNSNPTATSTNPSADHIETLAVETLIPTVSSPVPTACLNDSPKPSSDTRLISKRVTSQDDTPSLDNILTLTNRFEDILGVTTNTDDSNGVEADLGNMEDNISASPTPTLRIYKDHPKRQIIEDKSSSPSVLPILMFLSQEEPKKISDALQNLSWVEAMQEELLQFKIQNVWSLVDCLKREEGIDYDEVFALVAIIEVIRLFLAYASFMGFTVYQMDVKNAFLYGTIDEEVYVMQPPGFQDPEFLAKVYKVEKAMGTIDQTLFIRRQRGDFILVQVYVDDIIFRSSNLQLCREFKALMHEKFQMSALGELNFFIGLQVLQKKDGIFLSRDKYVGDILKKFGHSDVRSANTPMDKENPWGKDGTRKDVDLHLYRSMIESLMYLTASRPDIMFVVCACVRHQVTPKECHLHAVKRIFRYLKGHPKLGLWYPKESPFDLVAYSDSDYGGASQDRKSTTGGCQFLGRRLVSWQCKKQTIVATSTTEVEYVTAASGCGQVMWI
nr:hypothetical protein [Tanacetum cinerariifolium]